jgi:hypothetical protein
MQLSAPGVPQLHVDAIRTTLAEKEYGHAPASVPAWRKKSKTSRDCA